MGLLIPTQLHREFKTATAAQGKKMTDVLLDFIREYVHQHAPAAPQPKKGGR